jgi:hypothetical protein
MFSINLGVPCAGTDEAAVRARIKIAGLKIGFTCGALLKASGGQCPIRTGQVATMHSQRYYRWNRQQALQPSTGPSHWYGIATRLKAAEPSKEKYEWWQKYRRV